ncbi:Protein farnesyltransferase subunit beta [Holothuria leucospilota]|uniref:Protein farnesyltransferase subunit beta n=1 Tax=Holothuria leucospilota TaxID=206669 RepID=A0A9Q1HHN1_HOLLE|nr:Protein farnesyltransferase subunit beta [Holothuria leucospilota]
MAAPRCVENFAGLESQKLVDDGISSLSSQEQESVEESVGQKFSLFHQWAEREGEDFKWPPLNKEKHLHYLHKGLHHLPEGYECLDASRPWICYWILHSLYLLGEKIPEEQSSRIAQFIGKCQCPDGGFAGSPNQQAHLAPTYAAVLTLCTLGTEEAYRIINRETLRSFLSSMRSSTGAFTMHKGGEIDVRGAYCAVVAARLTNVYQPEMFEGTAEWIASCQSYEGGFAGQCGMEAHGGYTFCSIAALVLLGHERLCDMQALLRWLSQRQMRFEGGFQGRTNKLVDGCYSFWQAGAFPVVHGILSKQHDPALDTSSWMFNEDALQEYILVCCQNLNGGLLDKPGKPRDYYHTCYCLSGLSLAQHFLTDNMNVKYVMGGEGNELQMTHPIFNIGLQSAEDALQFFSKLPLPSSR